MSRIDKIFDYVVFLKEKYELLISFHTVEYEDLISASRLLVFNSHENAYCKYIKSNKEARTHCIECQKRVLDKCKDGDFCGTCYAGIREFVYPIKNKENIIGFISVSGYKDKNYLSYIDRVSKEYCFNRKDLIGTYDSLNAELPDKVFIDTIINPLCDMIELAYHNIDSLKNADTNEKILNYINLNHRSKITVNDLSERFFVSRSTISHNFKKNNGLSINDYINNLRLNDAKYLLETTNLSVTEISEIVGFSDVNYFVNVFTKNVNISPLKYRKENGTVKILHSV